MMMKKGLFGKSMMPGAMQPAYSMPQNMAMKEGAQLGTAAPQQQQPRFWQGGEKFTLRDGIAAALAVVGDGLSGGRGAVGSLMQSRAAPGQEAARLAEEQRKRAADLADYRAQMGIKAEFERPEAPKPGSFEWFSDPARTPQEKAAYGDYRDASTPDEPRMVTLPDGRAIFGTMDEIQRIIGGGAQGAAQPPTRPVGGLTPIGGGGVSNGPGSF